MKSELPIRSLPLAIKSAFVLALIAATFCAAPQVWAQQNLDSPTDVQGAQKQPEPKKAAPKKQKGFFESIRGTLEFGGRLIDLDGDKPAKFQETRQVPKGLYLRNINLDFENANSPLFFRFEGLEIRERDQRFRNIPNSVHVGSDSTRLFHRTISIRKHDAGRTDGRSDAARCFAGGPGRG